MRKRTVIPAMDGAEGGSLDDAAGAHQERLLQTMDADAELVQSPSVLMLATPQHGSHPGAQPGGEAACNALAKGSTMTAMDAASFSRSRSAADIPREDEDEALDQSVEAAQQEQGISWAAATRSADAAASKRRAQDAYAVASMLLAGTSSHAQTPSDTIVWESLQKQRRGDAKAAYDPIVWQLPESSRDVWVARIGMAGNPELEPARQRTGQSKKPSPQAERPTPQILWEARTAKAVLQQPPGVEVTRQDGSSMSSRVRSKTLSGGSEWLAQRALRSTPLTQAGSAPWLAQEAESLGTSAVPAGTARVTARTANLRLLQARMAARHAARRTLSSLDMAGVARVGHLQAAKGKNPALASSLLAMVPSPDSLLLPRWQMMGSGVERRASGARFLPSPTGACRGQNQKQSALEAEKCQRRCQGDRGVPGGACRP